MLVKTRALNDAHQLLLANISQDPLLATLAKKLDSIGRVVSRI